MKHYTSELDKIYAYANAVARILKYHISSELAFKIVKSKYSLNNLDFSEFLKIIKYFWYYKEIYPFRDINEIIEIILKSPNEKIDISKILPDWMYEKLFKYIGEEGIKGIFERKYWIRINKLKGDVDKVVKRLENQGFTLVQDENFSNLFYIEESPYPISRTKEFKEGLVIPNDKSSMLVVSALNPKPNEVILEIGSAPGIKTSIIQEFTENKARVICVDLSERRINTQKKLMKKLGVDNIELVNADALNLSLRNFDIDKILLDAPCSNSGTINTDPSIIIKLNKDLVNFYSKLQRKLLYRLSLLEKPIVFSTCSLFYDEGEKVVENFSKYLKRPLNLDKSYNGYGKNSDKVIRTFPHKHKTQGFFISLIDLS
ncbi:MAG: RsmB/NOP family class I SAM-dependent RNA methyltransferase [Sulfolobaceae archaeon]